MPIEHTVLFRLRDGVDEAAFLDAARRALVPVPGVQDFAMSRQVSAKSDLAIRFRMTFADRTAYEAYDAHPAHRAFVRERWATDVETFQEYDFTDL